MTKKTTTSPELINYSFTGKYLEYAGIWYITGLLNILTLGIYSAWATVRKNKYMANHTHVGNLSEDYHAKPLQILKGRILAILFLIGLNFLSILPYFALAVPIVLIAISPYVYKKV